MLRNVIFRTAKKDSIPPELMAGKDTVKIDAYSKDGMVIIKIDEQTVLECTKGESASVLLALCHIFGKTAVKSMLRNV